MIAIVRGSLTGLISTRRLAERYRGGYAYREIRKNLSKMGAVGAPLQGGLLGAFC